MRLVAIVALAAGCAGVKHVRLGVQLTGGGASDVEKQRCLQAVRQAGGVVDASAGLQALITVDASGNRLQLMSSRRGLVADEVKPPGPIEALCKQALAAARSASWMEPLPETTPDEPRPGAQPPSQNVAAPTSSGASHNPP